MNIHHDTRPAAGAQDAAVLVHAAAGPLPVHAQDHEPQCSTEEHTDLEGTALVAWGNQNRQVRPSTPPTQLILPLAVMSMKPNPLPAYVVLADSPSLGTILDIYFIYRLGMCNTAAVPLCLLAGMLYAASKPSDEGPC